MAKADKIIYPDGKNIHVENKTVYPKDDERNLSREELNTTRIDELIRRLDKITADLYAVDSKYALRNIPRLTRRQKRTFKCLLTNYNEFRIFRDILSALQREVYPLLEAYELQKQKANNKKAFISRRKRS